MFNLWKINTVISVLQLVLGAGAYYLVREVFGMTNEAGFIVSAMVIMTVVMAAIVGIGLSAWSNVYEIDAMRVSIVALPASASALFASFYFSIGLACFIVAALFGLVAFFVAYEVAKSTTEETLFAKWQPLLVVLLPFGVGTIFGGAILLHGHWQQRRALGA